MSLIKPSLTRVIKKQYRYKLKSYGDVFISLILLQLLAVLFSFNGVGSMGSGSNDIHLSVNYYSADMVIYFTLLWAFISAILITTKAYRNDDFLYVTSRVSSHLSNGLFLLTTSIIAGITAMLSGYLIKVIMYYVIGVKTVEGTLIHAPQELLIGIGATALYLLLFSVLGYFVGTLIQLNRIFIGVLPAVFLGDLFLSVNNGVMSTIISFFGIIFAEPSFLLFLLKMVVITGLLFACSIVISNRMEVR